MTGPERLRGGGGPRALGCLLLVAAVLLVVVMPVLACYGTAAWEVFR